MLFTANAIVMIEQDVHDTDMMMEIYKEELQNEFLDGEKWKEFSSPREYGQDLISTLINSKSTTKRKIKPRNFSLGKVKNMEVEEETKQEFLELSFDELHKLLITFSIDDLETYAQYNSIDIPSEYRNTASKMMTHIKLIWILEKGDF